MFLQERNKRQIDSWLNKYEEQWHGKHGGTFMTDLELYRAKQRGLEQSDILTAYELCRKIWRDETAKPTDRVQALQLLLTLPRV